MIVNKEENMTYKQSGAGVIYNRIIGVLLLAFALLCVVSVFINIILAIIGTSSWSISFAFSVVALICMSGAIYIALFHLWMYPDIQVSIEGMTLKAIFLARDINPTSITDMQIVGRKRLIISLSEKGMFYNRLYGLFKAGIGDQPIIIYSSNIEDVGKLEKELRTLQSTIK